MIIKELTLRGFDGSTDATDHLVLAVSSGHECEITEFIWDHQLEDLVVNVSGLPPSYDAIDFALPTQTNQLQSRIRELTGEAPLVMLIELDDTDGNSDRSEYVRDKSGEIVCKTLHQSEGWGDFPTASCEINGVHLPGDMWRFIEGTMGVENLYAVLNDPRIDGLGLLSGFKNEFRQIALDSDALIRWDRAVAQLKRESVAEIRLANGKKMAEGVFTENGLQLSPWEIARTDTVGLWEYANLAAGNRTIRVGVSGGGVVSLDGHPFAPDGTVNITAASLSKSLAKQLPTNSVKKKLPTPGM